MRFLHLFVTLLSLTPVESIMIFSCFLSQFVRIAFIFLPLSIHRTLLDFLPERALNFFRATPLVFPINFATRLRAFIGFSAVFLHFSSSRIDKFDPRLFYQKLSPTSYPPCSLPEFLLSASLRSSIVHSLQFVTTPHYFF